jgi:Mn2+ and Fe2+ transporters of the NRAMP family
MKKALEIALGIVTSVGGFLEIGSIATAAQAGAAFGFQLTWAVVLGGLCVMFLVEMSGRIAAVSKHTIADALRERFGFNFFLAPLIAVCLVSFLVLASELGGVCVALEILTGIGYQWWAPVAAIVTWLLLWKTTFGFIENGISLLGLVTVSFVVGAWQLHPDWLQVGRAALPSLPKWDGAHYWFLAVSILGASISPYLFYFYSSGAVEDKWDEGYLSINRIVASLGMGFGTLISVGVLIMAAVLLPPHGIQVDHYDQLPLLLTEKYGHTGFLLFGASLAIACLGAALELSLSLAYMVAQGFGWNWGENEKPRDEARFSLTYTVAILPRPCRSPLDWIH